MRVVLLVGLCGCSQDVGTWFVEVHDHGASLVHVADNDAEIAGLGAGVAVADVDGDELPDLAVAGAMNGFRLYRNLGGLRFSDVSAASGIDTTIQAQAVAFADLDNDGDQDLIVAELERSYVLENVGGGNFVDVSMRSTLDYLGETRGIQIADFDGDGLLDLLLLSAPNPGAGYAMRSADLLYHNRGGLAFENVTAAVGLSQKGVSLAAASVDFDVDGKLDLYIAKDTFSANFGGGVIVSQISLPLDALLHNDSPNVPTLLDTTSAAGIAYPRSSMGVVVADFDGNGLPDFYVSDYGKKSLFINQGSGRFVDMAEGYGIEATASAGCTSPTPEPGPRDCLLVSWGAATFDADLDGWDDLVVLNGSTFHFAQETSQFRGSATGFTPIDAGLPATEGRTLVVADLDRDGDLDLIAGILDGAPRIFENRSGSASSHWLEIHLVGTTSNRDGVGAVITARFGGLERRRYVGVGGVVHGYSNPHVHFGLGPAQVADLEIRWPDGRTQRATGVAADQVVTIQED